MIDVKKINELRRIADEFASTESDHSTLLSALIIAESNDQLQKSLEYCLEQLVGQMKSLEKLPDTGNYNKYRSLKK